MKFHFKLKIINFKLIRHLFIWRRLKGGKKMLFRVGVVVTKKTPNLESLISFGLAYFWCKPDLSQVLYQILHQKIRSRVVCRSLASLRQFVGQQKTTLTSGNLTDYTPVYRNQICDGFMVAKMKLFVKLESTLLSLI